MSLQKRIWESKINFPNSINEAKSKTEVLVDEAKKLHKKYARKTIEIVGEVFNVSDDYTPVGSKITIKSVEVDIEPFDLYMTIIWYDTDGLGHMIKSEKDFKVV
tara:strand:- start:252 stop:563 length:312 start_codon:yes stop_codon:yes gene_type:complete